MITNEMVLRAARTLLVTIDKVSNEALPAKIASMCKHCAVTASVAAFLIGWLPVAGAVIATIVCAIAVWTMYVKINTAIEIPFSANLVKSILLAVGTNLLAYLATIFVATLIAFIPAIGSFVSSVAMSVATYAITLASAYVYLNALAKMFGKERELKNVDVKRVMNVIRPVADDVDVQDIARAIKTNMSNERGCE